MDMQPVNVSPETEIDSAQLTHNAIDYYNNHNLQSLECRDDVASIFSDFTSDKVHERAVEAARLVDLADRLNDPATASSAEIAMIELEGDNDPLEGTQYATGDYVTAILYDIPVVNDYVSQEIEDWSKSQTNNQELAQALNADSSHAIKNPAVWLATMPHNTDGLEALANQINFETILVKSSHILATLRNPDLLNRMSDTDILRTLSAIDSVYVPLCKLTGFDALAAVLVDESDQLRFRKAGLDQYVEEAKRVLSSCGSATDIEQELPRIIQSACGDFDSQSFIDNGIDAHGLIFHEGLVSTDDTNEVHRIIARRKSTGAIAKKIKYYHDEGYAAAGETINPPDIIGVTIILPNSDSVGDTLGHIYRRVAADPTIELISAPVRQQPVHIKGPDWYRQSVLDNAQLPVDETVIDQKPHDGDFMYGKLTFQWSYVDSIEHHREVTVEIQCVDEAARRASRIGVDSHLAHKDSKYNGSDRKATAKQLALYEKIHARSEKFNRDEITINPPSHERSQLRRAQAKRRKLGQVATTGQ